MQVAFNAQLLSFGHSYRSAGISRYIANLLAAFRRERRHSYVVYYPGDALPPSLTPDRDYRWVGSRLPTDRAWGRVLWEQAMQPIAVGRSGASVLHAPAYVAPLIQPCPTVVTIHDLSFLLMPQLFNLANRLHLGMLTRLSAKRARRVIAVSDATRSAIVQLLGVPADRVDVVYHGIEPTFQPITDSAAIRAFCQQHQLDQPYLLYLGTIEPRKNVEALIRAYAQARRNGGLRLPLVVAGGRGWRDAAVFELVQSLRIGDHVRFTGFVPFEEQPFWYSAAAAFVYPSRLEGFGFPVLEAMACGAPVITSNRSALPEVAGDAALLVDPDDPSAIGEAIVRVIEDRSLAETLRARGFAHARRFTWEAAARRTEQVYTCAAEGGPPPEEEPLLVKHADRTGAALSATTPAAR